MAKLLPDTHVLLWVLADPGRLRQETRATQGGHDVPEAVIRRRFAKGLNNFENIYRHHVSYWQLINNSGDSPALIEEGRNL